MSGSEVAIVVHYQALAGMGDEVAALLARHGTKSTTPVSTQPEAIAGVLRGGIGLAVEQVARDHQIGIAVAVDVMDDDSPNR